MIRTIRLICTAMLVMAMMPMAALAGDAALKERIALWEKHFNADDAAGVASLYAEDAMLFPPGAAPVKGRQAIQAFWQTAIDATTGEDSLETLELHEVGDKAVEVGSYSATDADGAVVESGNYIVIWKKIDGTWMLTRDIWNDNGGS